MAPVKQRLSFAPGMTGPAWRFIPLAFARPGADPIPPAPPTPFDLRAAAYGRLLKNLLPRGLVWLLEESSVISRTLKGIANELARVDERALDLIEEIDPSTTSELLEDWERVLGIPDGCVLQLAPTEAERRQVVVQKLLARGGQTPAFFESIATAVGATSTVEELRPYVLRCGFRSRDRCYGVDYAFIWKLISGGSIAAGLTLPAPVFTVTRINHSGSLGAGTYKYRMTAINAVGKSIATAEIAGVASSGIFNQMQLNWAAVPGATGYQIDGRTGGAASFLVNVGAVTSWTDDGSIVPSGTLPPVDAPVITSVGQQSSLGGVIPAGTKLSYRVSALTALGETFASLPMGFTMPAGTDTNTAQVNWAPVLNATGFRVYGRVAGDERLLVELPAIAAGYAEDGTWLPHLLPPTASGRSDVPALTDKALSLECVERRASPAHTIVLFEYE